MYCDGKISIKNSEHFFQNSSAQRTWSALWHIAVFLTVLITRAKYLLHFWNISQTENENCLALLRRPPTLHFPPLRQVIFKVHQTVLRMQIVILLWNWAELMLWSMKKSTFLYKFLTISHEINFFPIRLSVHTNRSSIQTGESQDLVENLFSRMSFKISLSNLTNMFYFLYHSYRVQTQHRFLVLKIAQSEWCSTPCEAWWNSIVHEIKPMTKKTVSCITSVSQLAVLFKWRKYRKITTTERHCLGVRNFLFHFLGTPYLRFACDFYLCHLQI